MMWHDWSMGWHMVWMGLGALVLIAALIGLGWILGRAATGPNDTPHDSPEAILKRRFARGEIDEQEYERRLEQLRRG